MGKGRKGQSRVLLNPMWIRRSAIGLKIKALTRGTDVHVRVNHHGRLFYRPIRAAKKEVPACIPCFMNYNQIRMAKMGYPSKPATCCPDHAEDTMIHRNQQCLHVDCIKTAVWGYPWEGKRLRCKTHADEQMIDVVNPRCKICAKRCIYGLKTDNVPTHCKAHKSPEMKDICNRQCEHLQCPLRPNYGFESEGRIRFCKQHAKEGMRDFARVCHTAGCTLRPLFGFVMGKMIACLQHKKPSMVNVANPRCRREDCDAVARHPLVRNGKGQKLCHVHAFEAKIIAYASYGKSRQACACWDQLEQELDITIQHEHFVPGQLGVTGEEFHFSGTQMRADGFEPTSRICYEYHGHQYHGFPPEHPKSNPTHPKYRLKNQQLFDKTMRIMQRKANHLGTPVHYIWQYQWESWLKNPAACSLFSLFQVLEPESVLS